MTAAILLFVFLCAGSLVQSAELGYSSLSRDAQAVNDSPITPLIPQSISQNSSTFVLSAGTVACGASGITTENSWYRLFDLDSDHNLSGQFCAESLDYGIESAFDNGVPQSVVVTTACLDDGMPFLEAFLTDQTSQMHAQPDAELAFFNANISGCCNADTQSMSVRLEAPVDCTLEGCGSLYFGSNSLGQSSPSYFRSDSCGVTEPTDMAALGYPDVHVVMRLNGNDGQPHGGDPGAITQNIDPNSLTAGTIACSNAGVTTENSFYRLFDLDADHAFTGVFCVDSVDYAIETAVDLGIPQQLVVTTSCLDDGLPFMDAFLIEVGSVTHAQPDADMEFFNVAAAGCCDADTQSMSIELEAPIDCTQAGCGSLFLGSNNSGQIRPTYIKSDSCAVPEPTDLAVIGFPDVHLVMVAYGSGTDGGHGDGGGDGGGDPGGDGKVPATGGVGPLLLLVLCLGSAALYLRRRAAEQREQS